jgi:hypothetical protein
MDRREDCRVDVRLPCYVAFPDGDHRRFVGLTENMSRHGLLVSWRREETPPELPRPGDLLTAEIELPTSQAFGKRCMYCQVTVVRVSVPRADTASVAFRINHMQFRNSATGRFARADLGALGRTRSVM